MVVERKEDEENFYALRSTLSPVDDGQQLRSCDGRDATTNSSNSRGSVEYIEFYLLCYLICFLLLITKIVVT